MAIGLLLLLGLGQAPVLVLGSGESPWPVVAGIAVAAMGEASLMSFYLSRLVGDLHWRAVGMVLALRWALAGGGGQPINWVGSYLTMPWWSTALGWAGAASAVVVAILLASAALPAQRRLWTVESAWRCSGPPGTSARSSIAQTSPADACSISWWFRRACPARERPPAVFSAADCTASTLWAFSLAAPQGNLEGAAAYAPTYACFADLDRVGTAGGRTGEGGSPWPAARSSASRASTGAGCRAGLATGGRRWRPRLLRADDLGGEAVRAGGRLTRSLSDSLVAGASSARMTRIPSGSLVAGASSPRMTRHHHPRRGEDWGGGQPAARGSQLSVTGADGGGVPSRVGDRRSTPAAAATSRR